MRHTSPKRAAVAAVLTCLAVGLLAPLLLLTSAAPGSPKRLSEDPAVAALLTYEQGLDGSPDTQAAATAAAATLTFRTLSDGSQKVSRVGKNNQCYYLLISPDSSSAPSGVLTGQPADCT